MQRGCNKPRYKSAEAARRAAGRRTSKAGDTLRVYRCSDCTGMWHITSQEERGYEGAPDAGRIDREIINLLRLGARNRARARQPLAIPVADVEGWLFTTMHVSAHARRASLQRLAAGGLVRLEPDGERPQVVAWVRPSDPAIDRMVHRSLARRLGQLQEGLPGACLDVERWIQQWKTSVPEIPEPLRRASLQRLVARGVVVMLEPDTPHARVAQVLPMPSRAHDD